VEVRGYALRCKGTFHGDDVSKHFRGLAASACRQAEWQENGDAEV